MMLSRVADNLYWMGRYLERAEHSARLIDVSFDLIPERTPEAIQREWKRLFTCLKASPPGNGIDVRDVLFHLALDESNENSIHSCIANARENARQVREQISSEMWVQINSLHLSVIGASIDAIEAQPHEFFQRIKEGSHLFHGISDSTMNRGEGWHFIQVGQYIERAGSVAAVLEKYESQNCWSVRM